ncbi:hypothetical protein LTR37_007276 [Vermiconidia calcicola]|uniref:Uncharacterized protein n=1 Tax=Vermiconidia calcicola TaxID=1690605 RepID=A0ACC3NEQ8_9PEZI|nr:hypothetical protein LTR37_007276 [Vermiconidia calcicola]
MPTLDQPGPSSSNPKRKHTEPEPGRETANKRSRVATPAEDKAPFEHPLRPYCPKEHQSVNVALDYLFALDTNHKLFDHNVGNVLDWIDDQGYLFTSLQTALDIVITNTKKKGEEARDGVRRDHIIKRLKEGWANKVIQYLATSLDGEYGEFATTHATFTAFEKTDRYKIELNITPVYQVEDSDNDDDGDGDSDEEIKQEEHNADTQASGSDSDDEVREDSGVQSDDHTPEITTPRARGKAVRYPQIVSPENYLSIDLHSKIHGTLAQLPPDAKTGPELEAILRSGLHSNGFLEVSKYGRTVWIVEYASAQLAVSATTARIDFHGATFELCPFKRKSAAFFVSRKLPDNLDLHAAVEGLSSLFPTDYFRAQWRLSERERSGRNGTLLVEFGKFTDIEYFYLDVPQARRGPWRATFNACQTRDDCNICEAPDHPMVTCPLFKTVPRRT